MVMGGGTAHWLGSGRVTGILNVWTRSDDAVPWEECGAKVVLHAPWVQHSVTSQPAEAANGGGHMGDKNYVFGDDPEAVN
jgi:hypothetical protein